MEALIAIIGFTGLFFLAIVPVYIINGFVIAKLWLWFIVPIGLEPIGMAQAIGIGIIISMLTKQHVPSDKNESKWWMPFVRMYLSPFMALFVGWIVTWFI